MTSAYAPFNTSYTNRVPYLTSQEYQSAPTAMDVGNLVPLGSAAAQLTALNETIARASSWIDTFCMGAWGSLAATVETENARIWGSNDGTLKVHPKYWPILEVSSFSFAPIGGGGFNSSTSITPAGNVWIEPQEFIVRPAGVVNFGLNASGAIAGGIQYYCQWQYITGYPVSTLSASVAAGAMSISPVSAIGVYPGTTLYIYDEPYNEQVFVSSTEISDTTPVSLSAPTQYTHAAGVMVSNLPPAVKQAAILATTGFIKQRGSGALVVADIGEITRTQSGYSQNSGSDWDQARMLLQPYVQMFVGY